MNRNLSYKIHSLLTMFPAVALLGSRQSGKTTLCKQMFPDWNYVDLEKHSDFNRVSHDVEFFFEQNSKNLILDEAQLYPKLFEQLRCVIDDARDIKGRFLITGSSSPELLKNISESLAGRVAIIELGTFKANELANKPLSFFYNLFQKKLDRSFFDSLPEPNLTLSQIQSAWQRGGYPEPSLQTSSIFYNQWMEHYENTYINRDIASLYPKLNKHAYQRFLNMLCRLSGTILNKSDVARALEVSESSIREFLTIASGTFLWRHIPSFEKSKIKTIIKMPKGHIRDTGLLHALLRLLDKDQLINDPIVGHSFESFVIEEIIKGLEATMITHWSHYYYRTRKGVEIDLILDGPFGILPIEIKYGSSTPPKQLKNLENFVIDNQLPFGLLINQSTKAHWLSRYVFQLPATYL